MVVDNKAVEEHVLAHLPATFSKLYLTAPDSWYRPIDAALQRLRRRGLIVYRREGRDCIWEKFGKTMEK